VLESIDIVKESDRKLDLIPRLATTPFGREMQAHILELASLLYRKSFPSREIGLKAVPEHSDTHVDLRDCNTILAAIEKEFRHASAFMPPWDLDRRLIETSGRPLPAAALDLAEDYGNANRTPEPLTGGHRKAQAPLMTAMASLYAQARHENVYVFDLDYSNMGGTNLHFYKVLCAAGQRKDVLDDAGKPVHDDLYRQAMELTDRMARVLAEIPREKILSASPKCRVDTLRVGGDEVRYIVTDASPDAIPRLPESIHALCENFTRDLGLHDYLYAKQESLKTRRGGGGAVSWFRLGEPGTPYHVAVHTTDKKIEASKEENGANRLSDFFIGHRKASTKARYDDTRTAVDYLRQIRDVLEQYEAKYHITHALTPKGWLRESLKYYTHKTEETDPLSRPRLGTSPSPQSIDHLVNQSAFHHIPTPEDLRRLLATQYRGDLNERGLALSDDDQKLAGILFLKFPYPDYVTGTLMDSDFPMMAGIAAAIARRNQSEMAHALTKEDPQRQSLQEVSLWGLGIKFHNIKGFNAALGHEGTNALLDTLAHEILTESLKDVGLTGKDACVAHYGGGAFLGVALPVTRDSDGSYRSVDPVRLSMLGNAVDRRLATLNQTEIEAFLKRYDISLPAVSLTGKNLGDIPNGDEKERGWKDGLTATISVSPISLSESSPRRNPNIGGLIAADIQTQLSMAVSEKDARLRPAPPANHSPSPSASR
jgi:GGDEF domain-containing protein